MALLPPTHASRRTVLLIDVLFAVWTAAWVAVGIMVAANIANLEELPSTLDSAASALDQTAEGLRQFEGLPFVGDRIGAIAEEVEATAADAHAGARDARESIDILTWLLGAAIIVIPAVPALAAYLPWRIGRLREVRSVRQALARRDHQQIHEHLAHRALSTLPFHQLLDITPTPWEDVRQGRYERLAAAELDRLGIEAPDLPSPDRDMVDSRSNN